MIPDVGVEVDYNWFRGMAEKTAAGTLFLTLRTLHCKHSMNDGSLSDRTC